MIKNFDHAKEQLNLCREQKEIVISLNDAAERFMAHTHGEIDGIPTNYVSSSVTPDILPTRNLIRFGVRVWLSVVLGTPFSVEVEPTGSRDPEGIKKSVADSVNLINQKLRGKTIEKAMFRRIATDALVDNAVFLYDGIDRITHEYAIPFRRVINWRDAYVEPCADGYMNDDGGPSFVIVRLWLHEDEAQNLYGDKKVAGMKKGLLSSEAAVATNFENKKFEDLYPVMHWWGIDRSYITFTMAQVRKQVDEEWNGIISGQLVPLPEEPHDDFVEAGDAKYIEYLEGRYGIKAETFEEAAQISSMMAVPELSTYIMWRKAHFALSAQGTKKKRKYPGCIYHAEFQEDGDEFLVEPEASPYKHGQIPVSFFRRQEGSTYWEKGVMAEAIDLYKYVHYLQQSENIHLEPQARPFLYAIRSALPTEYQDPETGATKFADDLGKNKLMFLNEVNGINPRDSMGYIQPGSISMDVATRLRESVSSLMELFGASEIMRGMGPGAEASGKHIELKMAAATRPSTFMLSMIEDGWHKHKERDTCYIVEQADERWLKQILNEEQIAAIKAVRDSGDYEFITRVTLGQGMPTEWADRFSIWMQLLSLGYPGTPQSRILAKEMGIAIPSDAEIMKLMQETQNLMPPAPPQQGMEQPGMPQGQPQAGNINYGA